MESAYVNDRFNHAIHWDRFGDKGQTRSKNVNLTIHDGEYHVFAVEWNENQYKFYADGELTWTYTGEGVSGGNEFIILSTGVSWSDGNAHTGDFPNQALVDWIRVYELQDSDSPGLPSAEHPTVDSIASAAAHPATDAFTVTITFSESVTGLMVDEIGVTNGTASDLAGAGSTYTITVTPDAGIEGYVSVTIPDDAVEDASNNGNIGAKADFAVDTYVPLLAAATVKREALTLTYDENLDATSVPAPDAFTVSVGAAAARTPVSATVDGNVVSLSLSLPATAHETVAVSYTPPGVNPLRDWNGNPAARFTDRPVTNATPVFVTIAAVASSATEGEQARFTVRRTGDTDASLDVSVRVGQSGDVALPGDVGDRTVTFAVGATSVVLTVATIDDDTDEAHGTVTAELAAGTGYILDAPNAQTVTILDDDTRGIEVSATELAMSEGGSATYSVKLASQPTAPVEVTVSVAPDDAGVTVAPASLSFGTTDWRMPVPVTVTAAHDEDGADVRATVDLVCVGGDYAGLTAAVAVTVDDDDLPQPRSFTLHRSNRSPAGIWWDDGIVYVGDRDDQKLYAYRWTGEHVPDRDIPVVDVSTPMGLWADGTHVWVVDNQGGALAYRLSDGARVADRDIVTSANQTPTGIWSDGATAWVADFRSATVYAYRLSDGVRLEADDLVLPVGEGIARMDLWSDRETLWAADFGERINAFRLSDGSAVPTADVKPAATNTDPLGLWSDGETLVVTDAAGSRVHAYALPGSAAGTGPSLSGDATLSALVLSGIDIGTFASGTTSYAEDVGNDVSSTTVTATATDAGAGVTIAPADADAAAGHQVDLAVGDNTVTATVTAEDGTTLAYTVTVTRAAGTLAAQFENVPAAHTGPSSTIELQLRFSEPVTVSEVTLRDASLQVAGGAVRNVTRVNGRNDLWAIEIAPTSAAEVVIVLAAEQACDVAGAVCTDDGRPLSSHLEATIPGPELAEVSIEAGTGAVAEGTAATFTLTRTGVAAEQLTVAVSVTESGEMLASGPPVSVTFEANASSAELSVATEDDAVVEAASELTAAVADGRGYAVPAARGTAQATVEDNDVAEFTVTADPAEIAEGETSTLTVAIANGVSFAQDQAIALDFAGSTAQATDYTVSPGTTLTLLAGAPSSVRGDGDGGGRYGGGGRGNGRDRGDARRDGGGLRHVDHRRQRRGAADGNLPGRSCLAHGSGYVHVRALVQRAGGDELPRAAGRGAADHGRHGAQVAPGQRSQRPVGNPRRAGVGVRGSGGAGADGRLRGGGGGLHERRQAAVEPRGSENSGAGAFRGVDRCDRRRDRRNRSDVHAGAHCTDDGHADGRGIGDGDRRHAGVRLADVDGLRGRGGRDDADGSD